MDAGRGNKLHSIGLYFDETNQVRLLPPETSEATRKLLTECHSFLDSSSAFQSLVHDFNEFVHTISVRVEEEKVKAIGSRNALNSLDKERAGKRQQLQAVIHEKEQEMERLKSYQESLRKREQQLMDMIENLSNTRV